jgi:prephenate dehydrogenase
MARTVLVAGLGLMGGSLAAALVRRGDRVLLWHYRDGVAAEAAAAGLGVAVADPAAAPWDLAVACGPVGTLPEQVRRLAAAGPLVTDVGSVKGPLAAACADLIAAGRVVPSHPMCGSHRTGWRAADPDLWCGSAAVVCPGLPAPTAAVEALWRDLGCRIVHLDPVEHDRAVARASHWPHVCASLAAAQLDDAAAPLAASGFRDTTRVAAGSPALWADILGENRAAVAAEIRTARERLAALEAALAVDDRVALAAWLAAGGAGRTRFEASRPR